MSKTIADFISCYITDHEGGLSLDPHDNGNWTGSHRGIGQLVGSKYGVTAAALALYRGIPASSITRDIMAALTKDEAVSVGVHLYFEAPGFNKLPFNRVTLSIVDFGWGSGTGTAVKHLQRVLGLTEDCRLGPVTAANYAAWVQRVGEEAAARRWADERIAYDTALNDPKYINGWNARTKSFLPGTPWWTAWAPA